MTKSVPREATQAMIRAASAWAIGNNTLEPDALWRAMWDAAPAAQAEPTSDDARDAARYRWLRDEHSDLSLMFDLSTKGKPLGILARELLDAAIDAAMRADK